MPENLRLSSEIFWTSAALAASIDAAWLYLLPRLIHPERFFQLRLPLILGAGVFWGGMGVFVVRSFWEGYFRYFYPGWMHGWGIVLFGPSIGVVLAVLFFWIARHFPNRPIPVFFLAVGVEALLEHVMGIYSFKIMDIPMFRGVSPLSVLIFAIPEYILYWSVILLAAYLVQRLSLRFRSSADPKPAPVL
jgi:hypothetical protein